MVDKIIAGYDVVLGTRYRYGGSIPKNWGFHRKLISVLGNLFITLVFCSNKISDWTGGFGAISKDVFKLAKKSISLQKGYTFQISLHKACLDSGAKIAEVPFDFKNREFGKSKLGGEYFINAMYFVITKRLIEILHSSFLKVCVVGTIGATIQLLSFRFFRSMTSYDILSHNLSIELAVMSNFILNNFFTFRSHRVTNSILSYIKNFAKFNLISLGSIIIQNIVMRIGLLVFREDIPHIKDYLNISGILIGLVCNYYLYSKIIWKTKKKK